MKPLAWAFLIDSVDFTRAVIDGQTSLGGSESACLGLARALRRRGHEIHIFTTKLAPDAAGLDATGLAWHGLADFPTMNSFIEWDVVCALRMWQAFTYPMQARLKLLWNQDLLVPGAMQHGVMATAWNVDHNCYVSEYHRQQWEELQPELTPIGWATRNGIDLAQMPTDVTRDPSRIIHISRPERGLGPLLHLWPRLKAKVPHATLQICRYSSMYDQGPGSWSDTCAAYDRQVEAVNAEVGGITYLGELTKPHLYQAISDAAVMWYPGVAGFAETSCIAATEANACGTPFVGSYRGALVETAKPSFEHGLLIPGDPMVDEAYAVAAIDAVAHLLEGCRSSSFAYRKLSQAGREHAKAYDYAIVAAQWEAQVEAWFRARYEANTIGVLRQLLHEDDHLAAKVVAGDLLPLGQVTLDPPRFIPNDVTANTRSEASAAYAFCDYVIAGKDQGAEDYAAHALADPLKEAEHSERFKAVVPMFEGRSHVLDVACGNGSFAIALALANPTVTIHGLDYAQGNIDRARDGAERAGVADRCTFDRVTVYDFDQQRIAAEFHEWADRRATWPEFDGLFVGEFIEHVGNYRDVIDTLETALVDGAQVVYTCPHGACAELVPRSMPLRRGHVSRFHSDDIKAVWGPKQAFAATYLTSGITERGNPLGNWIIDYTIAPDRPHAGERPIADRILKTRPLQKLSVGLIVKDAENDLGRCLATIYKVADEIIIGDTGSTDGTKAVAEAYKATVVDLPSVMAHPEGFAGLRNEVLARCSGDWFLWIDADEQLINPHKLRAFLEGTVFHAYVVHQTHVYLDGPPTFDVPQRLFRIRPGVRFYGCIHEQPQDGGPNVDIAPALDIADPLIAHTGYLTAEGREEKRVERNRPLLRRDQEVFPDRELGQVLLLREAVIEADLSKARAGNQLTPRAQQGYRFALQIYITHFDDPAHKFAKIARPWYEAALRHLGIGWEAEVALAGKAGGLGPSRAKPERVWVRDGVEFHRLMSHRILEGAKKMAPVSFHTEPFVEAPVATEVSA